MKQLLIIGKNGQVSTYLQRRLAEKVKLTVASRDQIDLSKPAEVYAALADLSPSIIINPAAFTAVDLAETEVEQAFIINRDAVAEIARYCAETTTPLIHYSTDYVFSGDAENDYSEEDSPAPTGVYGQSKLEGEQAILASGARAIILRTSWVYSNHGKNFYKTMLALAASRDELSVVSDQLGAPTYAGSIADATAVIVDSIIEQGEIAEGQSGIYHLTCQGEASWYDFSKEIFHLHGMDNMTVHPVGTEDYPTPAKRPAFSVLNNDKLHREFAVRLPQWTDALRDCVAETKHAESS